MVSRRRNIQDFDMTTLIGHPASPNTQVALAVAQALGLGLEFQHVALETGEHHSEAFARLNPNRLTPVLAHDGRTIWETSAILHALCLIAGDEALAGRDAWQKVDVIRWQSWAEAHLAPAVRPLLRARVFGFDSEDAARAAANDAALKPWLDVLEGSLAGGRLVGSETTLADYAVARFFVYAQPAAFPMQDHSKVRRWFAEIFGPSGWTGRPG